MTNDDWLFSAINDPAGQLAEFWILKEASSWQEQGDSWLGIQGTAKNALEEMLNSRTSAGNLARVVIASQVRFFDRIDHEWSRREVLPLLNLASNSEESLRNFEAYLKSGFWTEQLLEAGLARMYEVASERFDKFSPECQRHLAAHLASLILRAENVDDRLVCAKDWTARTKEPLRTLVIHALCQILRNGTTAEADLAWASWLGDYCRARAHGSPIPLSADESRELLDLVPIFDKSFGQALELAITFRVTLTEHSRFLDHITPEQLKSHSVQVCILLVELIKNSSGPLWIWHNLRDIFDVLKLQSIGENLEKLREAAVSIGMTEARSW